jgi:chromosome segregation ATPase
VSHVTLDGALREYAELQESYATVRDRYADTVARLQDVESAYEQLASKASHTAQRLEATLQHTAAHEHQMREERQRADAAERTIAAQTEAIAQQASLDQKALEAERRASTRVHEASRIMAEHLREAQLRATEAEQRADTAERAIAQATARAQDAERELAAACEVTSDAKAEQRIHDLETEVRDAERRTIEVERNATTTERRLLNRIRSLEMATRSAEAEHERRVAPSPLTMYNTARKVIHKVACGAISEYTRAVHYGTSENTRDKQWIDARQHALGIKHIRRYDDTICVVIELPTDEQRRTVNAPAAARAVGWYSGRPYSETYSTPVHLSWWNKRILSLTAPPSTSVCLSA